MSLAELRRHNLSSGNCYLNSFENCSKTELKRGRRGLKVIFLHFYFIFFCVCVCVCVCCVVAQSDLMYEVEAIFYLLEHMEIPFFF